MASRSVLIVGGGIFGVASALELRRRGWAVTLTDPGPIPHPAASSTDISKMIRMDYGADELYMELGEQALAGWDELDRAWGEPLYHQDGFVLVTREPMRPGGFEHDSFELLKKRGHSPERLDGAALAARFPAWNGAVYRDGYFNPRAGWAESGRVVAKLAERARSEGVVVREGFRAATLVEEGSRVTGVASDSGERLGAGVVLVAAGAWTPTLLPHLAGVMWAVGQPVLHFRPDDPQAYAAPRFSGWAADIARTGWYGFPATREGIVKVANHGPGRPVHPDAPRMVEAGTEDRFRAFLRETFPGLAGAPLVHSHLCLYCDTWDGNFWIDHDADREGLVIAAGGSGHAFKFGPVIGPIIADVIERAPNPYAPRFARRERGAVVFEGARHPGGDR